MKYAGKSYFYVPWQMGVLEPERKETYKILEGKSHSNI
jgi:hypothetical protein